MSGCCIRSPCCDQTPKKDNAYSSLQNIDEENLRREKSRSGGSCLRRCIRDWCCAILFFVAILLLVAALLFRYIKGDEAALRISDEPISTETCVDSGSFCWLRSKTGQCSEEEAQCVRSCTDCTPFDEGTFYPKVIPMDKVEDFMAYAKTGSRIPESFHGIWWMDQSGFSVDKGLLGDPEYKFKFTMTAEVLISFGDDETEWQEETKCITPVATYGGTKGHYTFMNNIHGLKQWESFDKSKFTFSFCFSNSSQEEVLIWTTLKDPAGIMPDFRRRALGYHDWGNDYLMTPQWLANFRMEKKPWGWNRVSRVLTDNARSLLTPGNIDAVVDLMPEGDREQLKEQLTEAADTVNTVYQYPVLQVVDGNGKRTPHYETYLAFLRSIYEGDEDATPNSTVLAVRI